MQYRVKRFFTFLHPFSDPEGVGYLNTRMYEIFNNSEIFGHWFSANDVLKVPSMESEFVLNYILHTFGWLGIALPFISYGVSLGLINMISVGIIMSVYRRRSLSNL